MANKKHKYENVCRWWQRHDWTKWMLDKEFYKCGDPLRETVKIRETRSCRVCGKTQYSYQTI